MHITDQKFELPLAAILCDQSEQNEVLSRGLKYIILAKFGSIWQSTNLVSEEKMPQVEQSETKIAYGSHVFRPIKTK